MHHGLQDVSSVTRGARMRLTVHATLFPHAGIPNCWASFLCCNPAARGVGAIVSPDDIEAVARQAMVMSNSPTPSWVFSWTGGCRVWILRWTDAAWACTSLTRRLFPASCRWSMAMPLRSMHSGSQIDSGVSGGAKGTQPDHEPPRAGPDRDDSPGATGTLVMAQRTLLSLPTPFQRPCALLLQLPRFSKTGGLRVVEQAPTHQELAIMINASRETVTRAFQVLFLHHVLVREGNSLQLVNLPLLKDIAEGRADLPKTWRRPDTAHC